MDCPILHISYLRKMNLKLLKLHRVFCDLKALKELNLMNNQIKSRSENLITCPPFAELSQLNKLFISGQRSWYKFRLPQNFLEGLTNLSVLNMEDATLRFLHPHTFNYTPNLNVLFLSSNDFTDIPDISSIQKLKRLDISQTNLRSLDFLHHAPHWAGVHAGEEECLFCD